MQFPKTPAFSRVATALVFALPAMARQKPFTQERVVSMVRAGLGDDSGSKLIEQRGIDFALAGLSSMGGKALMPISARTPRGGAQCA